MNYYLETHSYIRDKIKVVLNYATKKELDHAKGVDSSGLVAKNYFIEG